MSINYSSILDKLYEDFNQRMNELQAAINRAREKQNTPWNLAPTSVELPLPDWAKQIMGQELKTIPLKVDYKLDPGTAGFFDRSSENISIRPGLNAMDNSTLGHELGHAQQHVRRVYSKPEALKDYLKTKANPKNQEGSIHQSSFQPQVPYRARSAEVDARAMGAAFDAKKLQTDFVKYLQQFQKPDTALGRVLQWVSGGGRELPSWENTKTDLDTVRRAGLRGALSGEKQDWKEARAQSTPLKGKVGEMIMDPDGNSGIIVSPGDTPEQRREFFRDRRSYRNEMNPGKEKRALGKVLTGFQAGWDSVPEGFKSTEEYIKSVWDRVAASRAQNSPPKSPGSLPSGTSRSARSSLGSAVIGSAVLGAIASAGDAMATVAGVYSTPEPKTRMHGEKTWGTDVGLAFDVTPEGELEADPAGMEAARRKQKEGRSFPTWYPPEK